MSAVEELGFDPAGLREKYREERIRRAGDDALTVAEAVPHLERGGDDGGLVFFGSHSDSGQLYDILDDDGNVVVNVTMESLIADWKANR